MDDTIAGVFTGFTQTIIGHPLDSLKVLRQSDIKITKKHLTPKALYKGFAFPFVFSGAISGLIFGLNENLYKRVDNHYVSGFASGAACAVLTTPVDLYKIRQQESLSTKKLFPFKGFLPTLMRETIATSLYFGSYNQLQSYYNNPLLNGGIAGMLSWGATYQIDTMKTRIQSDKCQTLRQAFKLGHLWRGITPCLFRSFIVNGIGFYTYEYIKNYLQDDEEEGEEREKVGKYQNIQII